MDQSQGQVKVIVVGDTSVGKSSLLLRFVNDEFNEFHDPTLGAAFLSKAHTYNNGKVTRFQVFSFKNYINRYGILQVNKNINPSLPFTIEVLLYLHFLRVSSSALCV